MIFLQKGSKIPKAIVSKEFIRFFKWVLLLVLQNKGKIHWKETCISLTSSNACSLFNLLSYVYIDKEILLVNKAISL